MCSPAMITLNHVIYNYNSVMDINNSVSCDNTLALVFVNLIGFISTIYFFFIEEICNILANISFKLTSNSILQ